MKLERSSLIFLIGSIAFLPFSNGRWMEAWAGFLGPLFLLFLIRSIPGKKGILIGYIVLVSTSCLSWISVNKVVSGPLIFFGALLAGIVFFIPYLFDRVARPLNDNSFLSTFYFPISWVAMDALFSLLIADQGSIAYSQFDNLPLLQLSSITGMTGITFVIAWTASTASWLYENKFRWRQLFRVANVFIGVVGSVFAFGFWRISSTSFGEQVYVLIYKCPAFR